MMDIMFLCTGNMCRSPMAEGLAPRHASGLEGGVRFSSAGTHAWPGHGATPEAVAVVAELGVDLSAHRSRQFDRDLLAQVDHVVCMTKLHVRAVRALDGDASVSLLGGKDEIDDPYGMTMDYYRSIRDEIDAALEARVPEWLSR